MAELVVRGALTQASHVPVTMFPDATSLGLALATEIAGGIANGPSGTTPIHPWLPKRTDATIDISRARRRGWPSQS